MLVYFLIRIIECIISFLPIKAILFLGKFFGKLSYFLLSKKRKIVIENIMACDIGKGKTIKEIHTLAKATFVNFGITIFEILALEKYKKNGKEFLVVSNETKERFERASKDGCLLLVSHFNNWEMLGVYGILYFQKIIVTVGQNIKNKYLDDWIKKSRRSMNVVLVDKKGFIKESLSHLIKGHVVAFLADQNAGEHGIQMEFLGRRASTFNTHAILSLRTKKPIIPVFDKRDNKTGKHELIVCDPIVPDFDCINEKEEAERVTRKCLNILEEKIKEDPVKYFWLHRRWKK